MDSGNLNEVDILFEEGIYSIIYGNLLEETCQSSSSIKNIMIAACSCLMDVLALHVSKNNLALLTL